MDRLILIEKLESLRRCVRRVEMRRSETVEALQGDPDRQDILALNLTRAVQFMRGHRRRPDRRFGRARSADDGPGFRRAGADGIDR